MSLACRPGRPGRVTAPARTLLVCVALLSILGGLHPQHTASAQPSSAGGTSDTSFEGVYMVDGVASTGATGTAEVVVSAHGNEVEFETRVSGFTVTVRGPARWDGPDRVVVPLSKQVRLLGSGTGVASLERTGDGWVLSAEGQGRVWRTEGSGTAEGPRDRGLPPARSAPGGQAARSSAPWWLLLVIGSALIALGGLFAVAFRPQPGPGDEDSTRVE